MSCNPTGDGSRYPLLLSGLTHAPLARAYRGAALLGTCDYHVCRTVRRAVARGLQQAFPAETTDPGVLEHWLRRHFALRAWVALDKVLLSQPDPHRLAELARLAPASEELLRNVGTDGRGSIIIVNHYGRYPLLLSALTTIRPGLLNAALVGPAGGRGLASLRPLYRHLQHGGVVAMALDEPLPPARLTPLKRPFLGGHLRIAPTVARMAARTGARLLYAVIHEDDWRTRVELRPLPDAPQAALAAAVRELARDVDCTPWLWWQWPLLDTLWQAAPSLEPTDVLAA